MNTKVYVSNLDAATTEADLMALFSTYGRVVEIQLPTDQSNDSPRRFGCLTMATPESAQFAIQALNGKAIGACVLTVGENSPRQRQVGQPVGLRSPVRSASLLF